VTRGIVILDGADATGKTTLAKQLCEQASYGDSSGKRPLYLHGRVWKNMWGHHTAMLRWAAREADSRLVVIDRLWISEQIYGATFRGGPSYDARSVDRILLKHGALTVLCVRKDLPRHLDHFRQLKDVRPEKFPSVAEVAGRYYDLAYGNVARGGDTYVDQLTRWGDFMGRPDVVLYDLDRWQDNTHAASAWVLSQLSTLRAFCPRFQLSFGMPNLAGSIARAQTLLVADKVSDVHPPAVPEWPFYSGVGMNSATWLNAALQRIGHDETRAVWTNASRADGELTVRAALASKPLRVVALGKVGEERLKGWGIIPSVVLPHPQWARRFQFKQPEIYAEQLRGALS